MNCGRKAKKKIESFGLRMLIRMPVMVTRERRARAELLLDPQRAAFAQRAPRHVEQIRDAEIFEGLERQRAGVQQRRKAENRRRHVRHDAKRAAERRDDAGARAAREPGRQGVDHAGAGRDHDDERGDEEFPGHDDPLTTCRVLRLMVRSELARYRLG